MVHQEYMGHNMHRRRDLVLALVAGVLSLARLPAQAQAARKIVIAVELPSDRGRAGRLSIKNDLGQVVAGPWPVLGKADGLTAARRNNSTRSTVLPYGDTPAGTYLVTGAFKVGDGTSYKKESYGIHGALRLDPQSGDAKVAKDVGGRTGLLIHSGDLGNQGRLRPTNGCLRLSNGDMRAVLDELLLIAVVQGAISATCSVTSVGVTVSDPASAPDVGYDEGDPPPTQAAPAIP
jgi:hypothetical protein